MFLVGAWGGFRGCLHACSSPCLCVQEGRCVEYAFSVTVPGRFSSPPFSPPWVAEKSSSGQTPDGTPVLGWWNGRRPAKPRTVPRSLAGGTAGGQLNSANNTPSCPGFGRTPAVPPARGRGAGRGLAGRRPFHHPRTGVAFGVWPDAGFSAIQGGRTGAN